MKEHQSTQFYDKLLHYITKTFNTNFKTQELYLDLAKNRRTLRFRSIKNIYHTLTEGKADQIIYQKDKAAIQKSPIFNQIYTKQTCWRLVEKLITKIAYYLTYQRSLKDLSPFILKAIHFTRKAPDKINNKTSFIHFFQEAVELLMEQNNILAKKIYKLLIDRGYICSVAEFYKLSRFEDHNDFIYGLDSQSQKEQQKDAVKQQHETKVKFQQKSQKSLLTTTRNFKGSRKGIFSNKKMGYRSSIFKNFDYDEDAVRQQNDDISYISQDNATSEQSSIQSQEDIQKTNKISHSIHTKVQKVMQQLNNHPNFQIFLASIQQDHQVSNQADPQFKINNQPAIKQIMRNLRLKNFKANEQILKMNDRINQPHQSQRKNSNQRVEDSKKKQKKKMHMKNRPSIATAVSKRMKQHIFKLQGVDSIQNLVIRNLKQSIKKNVKKQIDSDFDKLTTISGQQRPQKLFVRASKRQQTYAAQSSSDYPRFQSPNKRSNFQFLSNAFVFQNGNNKNAFYKKRFNTLDLQQDSACQNQFKSLQTVISQKFTKSRGRIIDKNGQNIESSVFSNEKINDAYKASQFAQKRAKRKVFKKQHQRFNTAIIDFAAKKYHRNSMGGQQQLRIAADPVNIKQLFSDSPAQSDFKLLQTQNRKILPKNTRPYFHSRKYEVYDRINRKVL